MTAASSAVFTHALGEESGTRPGQGSKQADVSNEGGGLEDSKGIWVTPWDKSLTDRLTSVTAVINGMRSLWPYDLILGAWRCSKVSPSINHPYNLWSLRFYLGYLADQKRFNFIRMYAHIFGYKNNQKKVVEIVFANLLK